MANYDGMTVTLTSDPARIDVDAVIRYLQEESYWAQNRAGEDIRRTLETSLCFSVLMADRFVGFARVVTDQVTLNYLCDFFILPSFQCRGIGTRAMQLLLSEPRLVRGVWILFTQTAHAFYRRFGFVQDRNMFDRIMIRHRPRS
jgi:GNAT superfamily N-acetyltransferase